MVQENRLGDRRRGLRFEVVGDLWATLTTVQSLTLVDIGAGGLLMESIGPMTVGSTQRGRLVVDEAVADVSAAVRHVRPATKRPNHYLVGLEFVDLPAEFKQRIDALFGKLGPGGAGAAEA